MAEHEEKHQRSGISRRDLIRRGAIVGGAVWVAPVIQSITSRAMAATATYACCQCTSNPANTPTKCSTDSSDTSSQSACQAFCSGGIGNQATLHTGSTPFVCQGPMANQHKVCTT
jgi:hypothetical protein